MIAWTMDRIIRRQSRFNVYVRVHMCIMRKNIDGHKKKNWTFSFDFWAYFCYALFFQWTTIETKNEKALEVNVNSDANTILAPIGRSTWLCTITHNNNKNWSHRRCRTTPKKLKSFQSSIQSSPTPLLPPPPSAPPPLPVHCCAHCFRYIVALSKLKHTHSIEPSG